MTTESILRFNGINGRTGKYLNPPRTLSDLAASVTNDWRANEQTILDADARRKGRKEAVAAGIDVKDLSRTGWGVILSNRLEQPGPLLEAIEPLLKHRRKQAGKNFRQFVGADGYHPGDSKLRFLLRHGAGTGPVDPANGVPYYLLLVGSPDEIPYSFQYQLDVQYAVGRIHFDTLAEYEQYARSVVAAETGAAPVRKSATFFGPVTGIGDVTELSARHLVEPLHKYAVDNGICDSSPNLIVGESATKQSLIDLLSGTEVPGFLFTASHGVGYDYGDPEQLESQGALICGKYPGPEAWERQGGGSIPDEYLFSGRDVQAIKGKGLHGMIAMHFACFGAGTPAEADFGTNSRMPRRRLAPNSFVARLPQRLLTHPEGGALAVISHVERAWDCSFIDEQVRQITAFQSALWKLMDGDPVGAALDPLNARYAELACDLASDLENQRYNPARFDPAYIAQMWLQSSDARNYAIIGDPAVRMTVAPPKKAAKPAPITISTREGRCPCGCPDPSAPRDLPQQESMAEVSSEAPKSAASRSYGNFGNTTDAVVGALKSVGDALASALKNITTVEVATYVSPGMGGVEYKNGEFSGGAELRALTAASLDGNTKVCVPSVNGQLDEALWKIHSDMVGKALANRTEMLKLAATTLGLSDLHLNK